MVAGHSPRSCLIPDPEMTGKRVYDRNLALVRLASRRLDIEPGGAIDLGILPALAGPRRPFHFELIAGDRSFVDIGFDCECGDDFAAGLTELPKWKEGAMNLAPGLLVELPLRRGERVLALIEQALGDRPGGIVLVRPIGPAGVDEEYLNSRLPTAV